jgi:hypothetical protein
MDDRLPHGQCFFQMLLRRVRIGEHVDFVHHVDEVCDVVPGILVADLEPVPGYCSVWYFYCAKKYTDTQGKLQVYRKRTITGGGGACWHPEIDRKIVQGSGGGTFCKLTYGRKTVDGSFDRMGWHLVEYDDDLAVTASNYVLCKVYVKAKSSLPSSSSGQNENASSSKPPTTAKKMKQARGGGDQPKASSPAKLIQQPEDVQVSNHQHGHGGGGDHPEAPPAKLTQQQESYPPGEDVQESDHQHGHGGGLDLDFQEFSAKDCMNIMEMLRDEPNHPEAPPASLIVQQQEDVQQAAGPYAAESEEHGHGGGFDFNNFEEVNADEYKDILAEMLRDEPEPEPEPGMQQPTRVVVAEPPEHEDENVQEPEPEMQQPTTVAVAEPPEHEDENVQEPEPELGMQQPTTVAVVEPPEHEDENVQLHAEWGAHICNQDAARSSLLQGPAPHSLLF